MTQPSTNSLDTGFGRRFLKAVDAASRALVKGVERLFEGASPRPQMIPVRVPREGRGRR